MCDSTTVEMTREEHMRVWVALVLLISVVMPSGCALLFVFVLELVRASVRV